MTTQKQMQSEGNGNTLLYDLRMKYERAKVIEFDDAAQSMQLGIAAEYERTGRMPSRQNLDDMAGTLAYISENIERQHEENEIMNRTAAEWRQLEYGHVVRSNYTRQDLEDDEPAENWANYRECQHRFCLEVWKPRRKDQKYCDVKCRTDEQYARSEYERTSKLYSNGTYLPEFVYRKIRDKQSELNYQKYERIFEGDKIEKIANIEMIRKSGKTGKLKEADRYRAEQRSRQRRINKETQHVEATNPSKVVSYKWDKAEIATYLAAKYPAKIKLLSF